MFKSKKAKGALCCALAAVCAGAAGMSLAGCSKSNTHIYATADESIYAMGTYAYLQIVGDPTISEDDYDDYYDAKILSEFGDLCKDVNSYLLALDKALSTTSEEGDESGRYVYQFNQAAAGETVQVDEDTYNLLQIALDMCEDTDGYYNPAVYYSVIAYGFGEQEADTDEDEDEDEDVSSYPSSAEELPTAEEIEAYTELAGHFGDIELSSETGEDGSVTYSVTKPSDAVVTLNGETLSMKIDLGGIGKGYATDHVSELIDEYNVKYPGDFKYGYFTFGNSSVAVKKFYNSEDGSENYTIGLKNPRDTANAYAQFMGKDLVLSTSGDYEQYYKIDGTVYCHIINPKTGMPINVGSNDVITDNVVTVTIAGGNGAKDDAYTTALMAMGGSEAVEFINSSEYLKDKQIVMVINYNGRYAVVSNIDSLEIESEIEGELE